MLTWDFGITETLKHFRVVLAICVCRLIICIVSLLLPGEKIVGYQIECKLVLVEKKGVGKYAGCQVVTASNEHTSNWQVTILTNINTIKSTSTAPNTWHISHSYLYHWKMCEESNGQSDSAEWPAPTPPADNQDPCLMSIICLLSFYKFFIW